MHWLLDVHFQEDKTKVLDMNVQKNLNIMRKIALNLARLYKERYEPRKAISGILKRNMYDLNNLASFILNFIAVISVTELLQNLIDVARRLESIVKEKKMRYNSFMKNRRARESVP